MKSVGSAHQYLMKPRRGALAADDYPSLTPYAFSRSRLREVVTGLQTLPTLPTCTLKCLMPLASRHLQRNRWGSSLLVI
jgi:hypothetical protein